MLIAVKKIILTKQLVFFLKKNFEKAKFKFEQDIVFNPKNHQSYLYLAKIFNEQKMLNKKSQILIQ